MTENKNYHGGCLRHADGNDSKSSSPLLFWTLIFLLFVAGPLGTLIAIVGYMLVGRLIAVVPKLAGRLQSIAGQMPLWKTLRQMPMWGVGLTLTAALAAAGFVYSPFVKEPAANDAQPPEASPQVLTLLEQPFVLEELHSGVASQCHRCEVLLDEKDPDVVRWKQSEGSHTVTLSTFVARSAPKVKAKPATKEHIKTIFRDEVKYNWSP